MCTHMKPDGLLAYSNLSGVICLCQTNVCLKYVSWLNPFLREEMIQGDSALHQQLNGGFQKLKVGALG